MCGTAPSVPTAQIVSMGDLKPLPEVRAGDLIVVPGYHLHKTRIPSSLKQWIRRAVHQEAHVCSVCTGAFVLAESGLLDGRECTTHWKRVGELQKMFGKAKVLPDRLFVTAGNITTSAGIVSGIDMTLYFIEQDYGPVMAARVAREMVVYLRRDAHSSQKSVFLDHRTHLNSGVHEAQDYIVAKAGERLSIKELARIAKMSPRNLTRTFRLATGLSIAEFRTRVRLELARTLLNDSRLSLEAVAERTGFHDARHFRRVWKEAFDVPPSASRKNHNAVN
jgi:transcriptional regulator GlxA family with amidase domain